MNSITLLARCLSAAAVMLSASAVEVIAVSTTDIPGTLRNISCSAAICDASPGVTTECKL